MRSVVTAAICLCLACLAVNARLGPLRANPDDGLAISISLNGSKSDTGTFDLEDSIHVKLTNNTDHDIQIWNPDSRQGYNLLTFEATNSETQESIVTSKRVINDDSYFERHADYLGTRAATVTIKRHESFVLEVLLVDLLPTLWNEEYDDES